MKNNKKVVVLATNSKNKIREIQRFAKQLNLKNIEFITAGEIISGGMPEVDETESTYKGNSLLKAMAIKDKVPEGFFVLADDSGFEIESLGGKPGVYAHRWGGEFPCKKVLNLLKGMPLQKRGAQYVGCYTLVCPGGEVKFFESSCKGHIAPMERNLGFGFAYDSIFIPYFGDGRTFGEMNDQEKDQISHRADGIRQVINFLKRK